MTLRREDEIPNAPAVRWEAYNRVATDLEQAREILRDLLAERGLPQWLADIATRRHDLVKALLRMSDSLGVTPLSSAS